MTIHRTDENYDHQGSGIAMTGEHSAYLKLATAIEPGTSVGDALAIAGADWEAKKAKIQTPDPNNPGELIEPGTYYIYRDVPEGMTEDGEPYYSTRFLGSGMGKSYRIIQNRAATDLAYSLADDDPRIELQAIGTYLNDRRFVAVMEMPNHVLELPNGATDQSQQHLYLRNSFDGDTGMSMGLSYHRLYCTNQLSGILSKRNQAVTIHHKGDVKASLAEMKRKLGFVLTANEEFELIAMELGAERATLTSVIKVAEVLWGKTATANGATDRQKVTWEQVQASLAEIWETEVDRVGANRWAALQTLSTQCEHRARTQGDRAVRAVESKAFRRDIAQMTRLVRDPDLLKV